MKMKHHQQTVKSAITNFLALIKTSLLSVSLLLTHHVLLALVGSLIRLALKLINRSYSVVFLDPLDATLGVESEESLAIINQIVVLQGQPDLNRFRSFMLRNVVEARSSERGTLLYPKLQQYIHEGWCGYLLLRQDLRFRIEDHVYLHQGTTPLRDWGELDRLVGELCNRPFPPQTSGWNMVFVPLAPGFDGLDAELSHFVMLVQMHHGLTDGVAFMRLVMEHVVDNQCSLPINLRGHRRNNESSDRRSTRFDLLGKIARSVFVTPANLFSTMMFTESNALHNKPLSGRKYVAISRSIPLQLVKNVRVKTGSTVNDVVMSCVAGTLRRHFESVDQPVPQELIAFVPMSMHSFEEPIQLCNNCVMLHYEVPVAEKTPLQRLNATKRNMNRMKESDDMVVSLIAVKVTSNRIPNAISKAYYRTMAVTCIISNVPGPQEECTMLGGHTVERMAFILPNKGNIGVGFSVMSYNNQLQVGVIVDGALVEGQQAVDAMVATFEKELHALNDAVVE